MEFDEPDITERWTLTPADQMLVMAKSRANRWGWKLTPRDLSALTPLIWEHVNPYGRFEFDMDARLPLQ